jgi:hypothetical protein
MVHLKNDLAGGDYWNGVWTDAKLPALIDRTDAHFRNYVNRALAAYFDRALATLRRDFLRSAAHVHNGFPTLRGGTRSRSQDWTIQNQGASPREKLLSRAGGSGEVIHADFSTFGPRR